MQLKYKRVQYRKAVSWAAASTAVVDSENRYVAHKKFRRSNGNDSFVTAGLLGISLLVGGRGVGPV